MYLPYNERVLYLLSLYNIIFTGLGENEKHFFQKETLKSISLIIYEPSTR